MYIYIIVFANDTLNKSILIPLFVNFTLRDIDFEQKFLNDTSIYNTV